MAIKSGDKNKLVKSWQKFLVKLEFLKEEPDGVFGKNTEQATKDFQKFYGIATTGVAASLTLGKAFELGFNPDSEPEVAKIRTDKDLMQWIKTNLSGQIARAIKGSIYQEDWLAGMCARETGYKIIKYSNQGFSYKEVCMKMEGDWSKRPRDSEKKYHGFGFWQIDIDSYADFVNSGDWRNPLKCCQKSVSVLDEKRNYLIQKGWDKKTNLLTFERAITASYNCGQGNVNKALLNQVDVDHYTFAQDYSKEVFRYRTIYKTL